MSEQPRTETTDKTTRELERLQSENARLRLIVNTIVPQSGCFEPDNDDQVERIGLEWCARYHKMLAHIRRTEPNYDPAD